MAMFGIEDIKEVGSSAPVLKVVGVGGGGGNAVNRMIAAGIRSVEFIVANTDLQDLKASLAPHKLQLGSNCTRGLGAGARPEVGREAALEDQETLREYLTGVDMVFITAGLGGGTGTGAAPVIAELAREIGCLTVGVVTKPFKFEGKMRQRNAEEGIIQLRKHVDTLIVIPNDNLLLLATKKTSIVEAFTMADDVLRVAIQGISDLVSEEGLINLDFADITTVMANQGQAIMGTGMATGENRAAEAAEKAIRSPLLDDCRIDGAKGILINVTGPESLTLLEVNEATTFITDHADDDAYIICGAMIDTEMPDEQIEVTVIATGFNGAPIKEKSVRTNRVEELPPRPSYRVFTSNRPDPGDELDEADLPRLEDPEPEASAFAVPSFYAPAAASRVETAQRSTEDVLELKNPELEPVETSPRFPASYDPQEKRGGRGASEESNLDIPAFIRRRPNRFAEE